MGDQLVAGAILLPLLAALLAYFVPAPAFRRVIVIATGILLAGISIALASYETLEVGLLPIPGVEWPLVLIGADLLLTAVMLYLAIQRRHPLAIALATLQLLLVGYVELVLPHHTPVAPTFALDRLSTTISLIVSIIGSLICVYALRYMDEHEEHHQVQPTRQPRFFFFMLVFLGAMNGLVFANDLGWLFFFWETTTLCSFMLIGHDGSPIALTNATRALWMNLLGGLGFGAALWLLSASGQEASLKALVSGASPSAGGVLVALSLLSFAGFTKAAQMPFTGWLLGAMVAPTPVSALLHSSAMVKAGVYLVVRIAPAFRDTPLATFVAFAGAFTFVVAAILALTPSDSKRVLAYSTISNLGLIIACAGIDTPLSLAAALMLILFHAVSKALLFLTVGSIEHAIGSRDIDAMEGLAQRNPKLAVIATIGIISMALPPAGMLLAKWVAIEAGTAIPLIAVFFAVGSAATVGFWVRWLGRIYTSPPGVQPTKVKLSAIYTATLGPLVAAIVIFSLGAGVIVDRFLVPGMRLYYAPGTLVDTGGSLAAGASSFPIGWLFAAAIVALGVPALVVKIKPAQIRPAYLCGENLAGPSNDSFATVADEKAQVAIISSQFHDLFREATVVRWSNVIAGLLIITLISTTVLGALPGVGR